MDVPLRAALLLLLAAPAVASAAAALPGAEPGPALAAQPAPAFAQAQDPPPRTAVLAGEILAPCSLCQPDLLPGADGDVLSSSVTFAAAGDPALNGIDGFWFDIGGFAGGTFTLSDGSAPPSPDPTGLDPAAGLRVGQVEDIRFFASSADPQDAQLGASNGPHMPKTGQVPAGADWAFVYLRRPSPEVADQLVGSPVLALAGGAPVAPAAPLGVSASAADGAVQVFWTEPESDGGAPVTGYTVRYGTSPGAPTQSQAAEASPALVTGLPNGVTHYFTVQASNAAGAGPASAEVAAMPTARPTAKELAILSPADGAHVSADALLSGTYTPGTQNAFENTHYLFLLNLNDAACGAPLRYGDHVLLSRLASHAVSVLGVPLENIHVYNEGGGKLTRSVDPAHYDQLPASWKSGTAFDGPARLDSFMAGLEGAAASAAWGEAAGGAPARLLVVESSHGVHNPGNRFSPEGETGNHLAGSAMCLWSGHMVGDRAFGDRFNEAVQAAEQDAGAAIEIALLIDCSFCGGFADSPTPVPGTTTTAADSAALVGPGRVVEVGCTLATECFGNPAGTFHHLFSRCAMTGRADGYGPRIEAAAPLADEVPVPSSAHHAPDGAVTVEEAYWCALESATEADPQGASGWRATDPQQMFQIVDQMDAGLFADAGFVLWDAGADQDLARRDPGSPLSSGRLAPGLTDTVAVALAGPGGASASGTAALSRGTASWAFAPEGGLAWGAWTATVEQSNEGEAARGPTTVSFTVLAPDTDGDGARDDADNCVAVPNDQVDLDGDGLGDACDGDLDGDGAANASDAFPADPLEWADADGDGVGDNGDRCAGFPDAADLDGDGLPDGCDADRDGDGYSNDREAADGSDPDDPASVPPGWTPQECAAWQARHPGRKGPAECRA